MNLVQRARDFISRRRNVYCKTFLNPVGEEVLADLARFCRANDTCFHPDARVHATLEGRREVFLRIQRHIQLSDEQLWALHAPASQPARKTDDD